MSTENFTSHAATERPHRPALVWVIAAVVLCATAFSLFSLALVPALLDDASNMSDAERQFLESQTAFNYALGLATILGNVTGVIFLVLLKRPALYLFAGALAISLADKGYNIVVNHWLAAVGTSGVVVALLGWAVNFAILGYTWSLSRRGVLR